MSTTRRRFVLALAALSLSPAGLIGQSDTLWRYTAPDEIRFFRVDPAGRLLVVTKKSVAAVDGDAGAVAWTYPTGDELRVLRITSDAHLLLGHGRSATAIDPTTGDTLWHRDDLPRLDRTSFAVARGEPWAILQTERGFAVLDMETGRTRWDSTALPAGVRVREYFPLSDRNLLILLARTPASDAAFLGVTLDSGRVVWRHDSLFRRRPKFEDRRGVEFMVEYQYPTVFQDSTLLMYFSKDGPLRMDPMTGSVMWRAAALVGRDVPGGDLGYPPMRAVGDSLLLVPSQKQLVALDQRTGDLVWRTDQDLRDRPSWMTARDGGALVGGFGREEPFLDYLDLATGRSRWPRPLEFDRRTSALHVGDTVWVVEKGTLWAVPISTGVPVRVAHVEFGGDEVPVRLVRLPSAGLILSARQNIARVEPDGRVRYHHHFKAPGASFWAKVASTALIVTANIASIALTPPGGVAWVIAGNPVLSERYARAETAEHFYYVFTEARDSTGERGFSLVVVDRRDGRELGRMWFDDRSPDYGLDHASGTVYVKEDDRLIVARTFAVDSVAPAHCDPALESLDVPRLDIVVDTAALLARLAEAAADSADVRVTIRFAPDGRAASVAAAGMPSDSGRLALETWVAAALPPLPPRSTPLDVQLIVRPGGGGILALPSQLTCQAFFNLPPHARSAVDSLSRSVRPPGDAPRRITLRFVVEADGAVTDLVIERGSGLQEVDSLVTRYVEQEKGEPARVGPVRFAAPVRYRLSFSRLRG